VASAGGLFSEGGVASQFLLWGVAYGIAQALLVPEFTEIQQDIWKVQPIRALAPSDLADLVVRGVYQESEVADEAAQNGIDPRRLSNLVHLAGEPPGLDFVLEAWRRGFIDYPDAGLDTPSVERAIKTSRIYNYWADVINRMAEVPISPGEAVNAALRGQIPLDQAQAEAKANGINSDRFQVLLDSAGRPPSPAELLVLLRRKLIPLSGVGPGVVSFQQGIFEGDAKDKWWQLYADLAEYRPPPRTVTTLLRTGSITTAKAQEYWQDEGLTPELAAAYAKSTKAEKLAGTRQLAEGTVVTLYETRAITETEATAHLTALGYDTADIALILATTDLQRELRVLNSAVTRVGTLYVGHKITRQAAGDALTALDVSGDHAAHLLKTWDLEAAANVRLLTPAQIVEAWDYSILTQDEAQAELVHLGYTPRDAWVLLSIKAKGAQPNEPGQGPAGPGVIP